MTTLRTLLVWSIAITITSCSNNTPETIQPEIKLVKKEETNITISATGIIKPKVGAEVKVGSRVSGVVMNLFVKNGDEVEKGQLLAKLDDAELRAKCRLEAANLSNAEAVLKYAKIDLERMKSLTNKEFASVQTYDNAVKEYEIANARVESQKAALDYVKTQLSYSKIFAPISGVIGSVSTQEGETVSAAFTAPTFVTIIDLSRIEVWTYVDETDIGKVEIGQEAKFTVDTYPGDVFNGTVTAIYPKAEIKDNVVNYITIIEITNKKNRILRPEMTTSVTIEVSKKKEPVTLSSVMP